MKTLFTSKLAAALLLHSTFTTFYVAQLPTAFAQGTAFTYQGRLNSGGGPANGFFDITFSVWTNASGPAQVGGTLTNTAVVVSNGLFTVTLDFGSGVFTGEARWLEVALRTNSGGSFTTLSPRQPITAAPYAIIAGNVTGVVPSAALAGTYASAVNFSNPGNQFGGLFTGNGGALSNLNASALASGVVPAGALGNAWQISGNAGTTTNHFLGTTDTQPLEFRVNGQPAVRVLPTTSVPNFVGGLNAIKPPQLTAGVRGAVIAGGGAPSGGVTGTGAGDFHQVTDANGTISGGFGNKVGNFDTNVDNAAFATVAGGVFNSATNYAAAVGGGDGNLAGGTRAVVAGGAYNAAFGDFAASPGGYLNTAAGNYSLAAGRQAKALHHGSFVWADSTAADFASTANNQFLIRAAGGLGVGTANPQAPLHLHSAASVATLRIQSTATPGFGRVEFWSDPQGAVGEWRPGFIQSTDQGGGGFVGGLAFFVNGSGYANRTSQIETMRLVDGKVGIGRTNPQTALDVNGSISALGIGLPANFGPNNTYVGTPGNYLAFGHAGVSEDFIGYANNTFYFKDSPGGGDTCDPTVVVGKLQITGGCDLAEPFEVNESETVKPGMLVGIDPKQPGRLRLTTKAYDRAVAGVISGANGIETGLTLNQENIARDGSLPVALTGRVYCWADASHGPIEPGDLLTTSEMPGHAMKVTDHPRAQGAIIGKAMSPLDQGQGMVLVLVSLQ